MNRIGIYAIVVSLYFVVSGSTKAELVELTTANGCLVYVDVDSAVESVEWTEPCKAGKPIEGSGVLKVVYESGGHWFEISGPFQDGAGNGMVRVRSARGKTYGQGVMMRGGCFGTNDCTPKPTVNHHGEVKKIGQQQSKLLITNVSSVSATENAAREGSANVDSDKHFQTHSCTLECASAYSVDIDPFTHYYNKSLTATLYAGETYEIKRDAWCREIISQDTMASIGELQNFISEMRSVLAKRGSNSVPPNVQPFFDYKECMLQNKLGNPKKDYAGSTQSEIWMACNKQITAVMSSYDMTTNSSDPVPGYQRQIAAWDAVNQVLQNDSACKGLKSKNETIDNNRRIIRDIESQIAKANNQKETPTQFEQDCRGGNPYIPKNTCQ